MSLLSRLAVQAARAYGILSAADKNKVAASYLVVAGGGSGGSVGGGGGAGGYQASTFTLSTLNTYSITVGAGATFRSGQGYGYSGSNSVISGTGLTTVTSVGGGGGAGDTGGGGPAGSGGSGGGGCQGNSPGTGTSGQGNSGGTGINSAPNYGSGGGGGASATGGNGTSTVAGNGGAGSSSSISGSSVTYAGGGGGGAIGGTAGSGGSGGGGAGSVNTTAATSGTANTGGGGGGGGYSGSYGNSGAGGSGIVIISYASATPKFVGGTLTTSGGNQIHTFTSSGTLSPLTPVTASYLVVAGGGSGGSRIAGGGGAGGLLTGSTTLYSGATYVVTVGAGGASVTSTPGTNGNQGSNSVLSGTGLTTITSTGGGFGGAYISTTGQNGGNGGSGGGAAGFNGGLTGGTGISGQGFAGGNAVSSGQGGGGGGGSSAVGGNGGSGAGAVGGNGGAGTALSITGSSVTYAGGGGGGGTGGGGTGGAGGGGAGSDGSANATPGTANTGGGGGGARNAPDAGGVASGSGGSGIVIISYAGSQVFNGGLVTSSGGNTIHTFTATGALTPLTNNLTNSLRFRSSASAYLNRTFSTNGTSQTKNSFSFWVKRGFLGVTSLLFEGYDGSSSNGGYIRFDSSDVLSYGFGGASVNLVSTTQVFRDPSAWYHIVIAVDTTQATASNRIKFYVNGNQVTTFGTANYPSQNATVQIFNSGYQSRIGRSNFGGGDNFDGYLADVNFIDGQALEPYYFGNNDANGVWKPIQYRGTYGTNGFYLNFSNTTSTTTLGNDSSGNGNNWTTNNISLTAGVTYDAMTDVPTNTSATTANYCVLNPLFRGVNTSGTMQAANLELNAPNNSFWYNGVGTTFVSSGKWYAEFIPVSGTVSSVMIGIVNDAYRANDFPGGTGANGYSYVSNTGNKFFNNTGAGVSYGASYTTNDVIGVALDLDAGTLTFYKNNVSQGTAFTGIAAGNWTFAVASAASSVIAFNAGQRPFAYTPPTGFVALNTFNLPTPTILQGNRFMDATLYTGNGSGQTVVNAGQFKPDFIWVKPRNTTEWHELEDSVRGIGNNLYSNTTNAEDYLATRITSINSNGFSIGSASGINGNGNTNVAWQWQAGQGSTSSNTAGSITSTVSVNTTAGFSIATFTSTGAAGTVGHGLGVAPSMIIVKARNNVSGWPVYHASIGNTGALRLDQTAATSTTIDWWRNTSPTSSVFSIGANFPNAFTEVAYCWAAIPGFSAFGSYVGNGSADGPFVYTGFRPKFIMFKISSTTGSWAMWDTSRASYNAFSYYLPVANLANAEASLSDYALDILSNGFKCRGNNDQTNTNGATVIYMAFAEHPFKNSNAR